MFHVNNNDEAKPCRAKIPENCRFYKGEDDTRHYKSVAEAQSFIEQKLTKESGGTLNKKVRYSFVKEFKKQEDKFNKDFDGIPNRFFNADLRGKYAYNDDQSANMKNPIVNTSGLGTRLLASLSAPSDSKINSEEAVDMMKEQGFENVEEITDPKLLRGLKAGRAWKVKLEDRDAIVIDGNAGTTIGRYAFRTSNEHFKPSQYWYKLDLRNVAGNARAERKTGVNVLKTIMMTDSAAAEEMKVKEFNNKVIEETNSNDELSDYEKREHLTKTLKPTYQKTALAEALTKLEDAQLEGKNFIAQKKYIKEHSGKVATAYMDKKNPDKIRQDLMKNTRLNKYFRKVEIDNDVDPAEFSEFEKEYEEVMDKLPKVPKGKEPDLRLRKLGKHRANGIYFAHTNTVSIDVSSGRGSVVHELSHQYDITVKNNASLRKEFREIAKEYSDSLKVPESEPASREEYLKTPTEIMARGMEHFAHSKLGIKNSLIDINKFDNYDHEPFKNPELRDKIFAFFEKLYDEDK